MYKAKAGVWGRRGSDFASCGESHPEPPSFLAPRFPLAGIQGSLCASRLQQPPHTHRELLHVSFQNSFQVELFQLPLQSWRQPRVHGGPSRQHNVLVEFRPDPKNTVFVVLYILLCTCKGTCTERGVNTNLKNSHYARTDCTISADLLMLFQKAEIKKLLPRFCLCSFLLKQFPDNWLSSRSLAWAPFPAYILLPGAHISV